MPPPTLKLGGLQQELGTMPCDELLRLLQANGVVPAACSGGGSGAPRPQPSPPAGAVGRYLKEDSFGDGLAGGAGGSSAQGRAPLPRVAAPAAGGAVSKGVLLCDVREEDFEGGHVPGAVNLPYEEWSRHPRSTSMKLLQHALRRLGHTERAERARLLLRGDEGSLSAMQLAVKLAECKDSDSSSQLVPSSSNSASSNALCIDASLLTALGPPAQQPVPERLAVVFHCMYCKERGPACAAIFLANLADLCKVVGVAADPIEVALLEGGFSGWLHFVGPCMTAIAGSSCVRGFQRELWKQPEASRIVYRADEESSRVFENRRHHQQWEAADALPGA